MNNMNYSGNQGPGGQMPPHQYMGQQGGQPNRMVMQQGGRMMPNQPMNSQNMMHMQGMRYPPQQGQQVPHGQMGQMGRPEMGQQMSQQQQNHRMLMTILYNNMPPEWRQRVEASKTNQERQKVVFDYKEHIGAAAVNSLIAQHRQNQQMGGGPPQMHRQGSFQMNQPNQFQQQPQQGQHDQFSMRSQQFLNQQGPSQEQKVGAPTQMGQMQNSPQVVQRPGSVKPVVTGVQPSPQFQNQYQQGGPPSVNAPGTPQHPNQIKNHSPMAASAQLSQVKVQQRPGGPGSVGGPRSMHYAPSPGMAGGPGSVQNQGPPSQPPPAQPLSVQGQRSGTPNPQQRSGQTPTPIDKDQPEYKAVLEELKSLRQQTLILLERVKLDRHQNLEKSLVKVIEIMEGKKEVDLKLMQRLLNNVKTSINLHRPVRYLNEFVGRLNKVPKDLEMGRLPDKWEHLDKMKIKMTDSAKDNIKDMLAEEREKRKRKAPTMSEVKVESDDQDAVYELKSHVAKASKIRVKRPIYEELEKFTYYVDPDFLPITDNSNYVQIIVEFKPKELDRLDYVIPPLRILIPREYPAQPVQLGHLIPFRADPQCPVTVKVMEALTKEVDEQVLSSLTQLIALWRRVSVRLLIPNADRNIRKQLGVN
ncbi:unnamed protein product [Bursaphelenchus xylophilus]|uniref:(pine wood nematode) hypothetical protein n=1 Tax=Bursaphelenchus xylophilus TaxID=6326 RepID=A0A1I7S270_BURXY|nr:unnamed protein product [Bursaphelenchus xylophilus]CAG9114850.1 unnamed protein product [Bursaphelenchus xylophilus]